MRTPVFILVMSSLVTSLSAQNSLPTIPRAKGSHIEIKGTYIPRGGFASKFPNFMQNGIYLFDMDNSIPKSYDDVDAVWYRGLYNFNSSDFPAFEEKSSGTLEGLGKVIVQFTTDSDLEKNYFSKFYAKGLSGVRSKTDIDHFNVDKNDKENFEQISSYFQSTASALLNKKKADSYKIAGFGTLELPDTSYTNGNLHLQFVFVQSNIWTKDKTSNSFPSHALYKLIVKDGLGRPVKGYSQAIFMEADGFEYIKEPFAIKHTISPAFENLVNRFLNDKQTLENVQTLAKEEDILRKSIPHYDTLYSLKRRYSIIQSRKQQLLFDLYPINNNYDDIASDNEFREKMYSNRDKTFDNNIVSNLIDANNFGSLSKELKSKLEANKKKLFALELQAFVLKEDEKKILNEKNESLSTPFDMTFVFESKDAEDNAIASFFTKLANKKSVSFDAVASTSKVINSELGQAFVSNFNSLLNQKQLSTLNNSSSVETSAISNTSSSTMKNSDLCQQNATAEAYKSQEYSNWMRTKLNADAYDYNAKLIELSLQYCIDKLPANDVQVLTQAAADARRAARELRSNTGNFSFSGSNSVNPQSNNNQQVAAPYSAPLQVMCSVCSGKKELQCNRCGGSGKVKAKVKGMGTWTANEDFCPECNGVGKNTCTSCNGTGTKKPKQDPDSKARKAN